MRRTIKGENFRESYHLQIERSIPFREKNNRRIDIIHRAKHVAIIFKDNPRVSVMIEI